MITDRSMCREAKPRTPTVERKLDAMSQAVGARLTMNSPSPRPSERAVSTRKRVRICCATCPAECLRLCHEPRCEWSARDLYSPRVRAWQRRERPYV